MLRINELMQLDLGVQGENEEQAIQIDMSPWLVSYPNGSVTIWHRRNGESVPYPTGAELNRETGVLTWIPTGTDTFVAGEGEAEIRLTENNVIKKSRSIRTNVSPAVTMSGGEQISGWQQYINAVEGLKGETKGYALDAKDSMNEAADYADAAHDAIGHYPYVNPETRTWMIWNELKKKWSDTGIKCEGLPGEKGDKGDPGEDGRDAVIIQIGAMEYAFHIDTDGHLILAYGGEQPPDFRINEQGHLIYTF